MKHSIQFVSVATLKYGTVVGNQKFKTIEKFKPLALKEVATVPSEKFDYMMI